MKPWWIRTVEDGKDPFDQAIWVSGWFPADLEVWTKYIATQWTVIPTLDALMGEEPLAERIGRIRGLGESGGWHESLWSSKPTGARFFSYSGKEE